MVVSMFVLAVMADPLPQSTLPVRLPQSTLTVAAVEDQEAAYRDLCRWAEQHPGRLVIVYVKADPPADGQDYVEKHCRYDAGWPEITTPTRVVAVFRDGQFVEVRREAVGGAAAYPARQPLAPFPAGGPAIQAVPAFPARPQLLPRFGRLRGGTCGAGGCH